MQQGKFIVLEGLDGSGQTTMSHKIVNYLNPKKALLTKEPRPQNKLIRTILEKKHQIKPKRLQELFAQDRKVHLKKEIIPSLKKGKYVVCDRYIFSSFAYGQAAGVPLKYLKELNKDFLLPDIVFFLNASVNTCLNRIALRGQDRHIFEKKSILEKVYKNFLDLADHYNFVMINAEKNIGQVFKQIKLCL